MPLCELREWHSLSAITPELPDVRRRQHTQGRAAKYHSPRFGIPQTGSNPLTDQAALQFRNRSKDSEYHLARWGACIETFGQRNEGDTESIERFQCPE
jgi:hypothetical protein